MKNEEESGNTKRERREGGGHGDSKGLSFKLWHKIFAGERNG